MRASRSFGGWAEANSPLHLKQILQPYLLTVVIVPVLFLPEVMPLWLVCVALGLVPVFFIWQLAVRHEGLATPFTLPILWLLLSLPLSLYASVDVQASLSKLGGILSGVCLLYALLAAGRRDRAAELVLALLMVGGLGMSLLALVATDWQTVKLPLLGSLTERLPRLIASIPHPLKQGGGINPNEVGGALALILPLALVLTREAARSPRVSHLQKWGRLAFLILVLVVALFTLSLSESRSAIFGLAIGVCMLFAIRYKPMRIVLAVLLVLAVVATFGIGVEQVESRLFDAGASGAQAGSLNLPARLELWQRAVFMLQDFPFTGIGLGTFPIVLGLLYPLFMTSPDVYMAHAHNILLQVGVDLGIPGLVSYAALLTVFFGCALLGYRRNTSRAWRAVIAGLAAGMVAHQVYGLTDAIALGAKPGILFWMFLALIGLLYTQAQEETAAYAFVSRTMAPVHRVMASPGGSPARQAETDH